MDLEDYRKLTGMKPKQFADALGLDPSVSYRYRTRQLYPSYIHALNIVEFSKGVVTMEDLGWDKNRQKIIGWQKPIKMLRESKIHTSLPADAMDTLKEERENFLQSKGEGEGS